MMRKVMLQLKTGYLKSEPVTYTFMKKYPPLPLEGAQKSRKIIPIHIPYVNLYEKVVERNPLYADEGVYPAFWHQEPQALTLAKKQYELIQKGLDEETAYAQAVDYVNELESKSYEELNDIVVMLKEVSINSPFTNDKEISDTIAKWHKRLNDFPYDDMELADQGELDYFIQSKVLKWNEVERERRMRDPVFVMQFEKLRTSIFPQILGISKNKEAAHKEYKQNLLDYHNISANRLRTSAPFYLDDYIELFEKLKKQPHLIRWREVERESLSRWVVDCLAVVDYLDRGKVNQVQKYLDLLRAQFFPMIKYPQQKESFSLPDKETIRRLLYENDIGYRNERGRLYIKRFYLLPKLLFPEATMTTALMSDPARARALLQGDSLLQELVAFGVSEQALPRVRQHLETFVKSIGSDASYGSFAGRSAAPVNMSSLDALLRDYDDDEVKSSAPVPPASPTPSPASDGFDDIFSDDPVSAANASDQLATVADGPSKPGLRTVLERERDSWLQTYEYDTWEEAKQNDTLWSFNRDRMDIQVLVRARLATCYEKKEGARRRREWEARGVITDDLSRSSLKVFTGKN